MAGRNGHSNPRAAELRLRARAARARAEALRARADRDCDEAQALVSTLVESLLRTPAPIGDWGETFSLRLARVRPAVRLVREHLGRWLERGGIDADEAFDVTLACSEACANAVEHPVRPRRPAFEIEATRSADVVELVVRDFGTWDESPSSRSRGRGLRMIGALMDSSQVAHDARGARVVMRRACKSGRRSVARG